MSNGFSAADMSTAAANGHAEGYQAGYVDAVKAVEAGSSPEADARTQIRNAFFKGVARTCDEVAPGIILSVAAQEAVAYIVTPFRTAHDGSYENGPDELCFADEASDYAKQTGTPLYAAPVAAAPAIDPSRLGAAMTAFDDAGGNTVRYAPKWMRKALEAASTPAAPGIDLRNALLQLREDALHMKDPGDTVNAYNRVLALIDASPKGGNEHFQDRLAEIEGRPRPEPEGDEVEEVVACLGDDAAAMLDENTEDERALNMQRAAELLIELQESIKGGSDARVTSWRPIAELPISDDLFWFARGDTIDGPRLPQPGGYDADEWNWFAAAEAPEFTPEMDAERDQQHAEMQATSAEVGE